MAMGMACCSTFLYDSAAALPSSSLSMAAATISHFSASSWSPGSLLHRVSAQGRLAATFVSSPSGRTRKKSKLLYPVSSVADYSAPIDVVADVKTEKLVVLGGSGFVGSAVVKTAVNQGIEVVSLSRSGRPSYTDPWVDQVLWISADVFSADWDGLLNGVTAVVSTIGGFGTNEQMQKLNGEANTLAVDAASKAGVSKFVLISVHDYNLPPFFLSNGYFEGKRQAEAEVLSKFPNSGTVLRPGFIYGKRRVNGIDVPLDLIGGPLEKLLVSGGSFIKPLSVLPGSDLFLSVPVSVDDVARAAVKALLDDSIFGILNIEQIKEAAKSLR
ncbi:hypothetical protein O6H91_03G004800 [Diphasiastrum complanatum]|uniref:Uncharacterized protein n=1 Tax=Diphasiastrum complanatum TaxID=34168 RepID=A0ACC2E3C6_DIPCM|nr:hypothetical protein O6H91_03G004800 [Diphasiastrum complanatum]